MEQSPLDEKPSEMVECSMRAQGTIVGEGVSLAHQTPGASLTQHNHTDNSSRHPLAALSFPDQTVLRTDEESGKSVSTKPSWSIYQSPEKEPEAEHQDAADVLLPKRSFHSRKSGTKPLDVLMSPKAALGLSWLQVDASAHASETDLDVMMSPHRTSEAEQDAKPMWTIYQSPEKAPETDFLWAKSPEPMAEQDLDEGEVQFLLPKKSFQQRRSGTEAVRMLHESLLRSPKPVFEPAPEPTSPAAGLDWLCAASPPRPTESDLDVMASPESSEVPMSPGSADTTKSGIDDITAVTPHIDRPIEFEG